MSDPTESARRLDQRGNSSMRTVLRSAFLGIILATSASAYSGVTIHYEGRAQDTAAVERVLVAVSEEAKRNGWQSRDASSPDAMLERVIEEKDVPYRGPI